MDGLASRRTCITCHRKTKAIKRELSVFSTQVVSNTDYKNRNTIVRNLRKIAKTGGEQPKGAYPQVTIIRCLRSKRKRKEMPLCDFPFFRKRQGNVPRGECSPDWPSCGCLPVLGSLSTLLHSLLSILYLYVLYRVSQKNYPSEIFREQIHMIS